MNADDGNTETIMRAINEHLREQNRRVWSHESDRRVQREEPVR